jgi:hypothetical protein
MRRHCGTPGNCMPHSIHLSPSPSPTTLTRKYRTTRTQHCQERCYL